MNRTGLLVALSLAALIGIVFGFYPELDVRLAGFFLGESRLTFPLRIDPWLMWLRSVSMWIVAALVAPAVIALVIKLFLPRTRLLVSGRAIIFLLATLVLAPGLVVNAVLKDSWPRSRPIDVPQFGGSERFVAWWDPRGSCTRNCSFVTGDGSAAFWTMAPAALTPPPWRAAAYAAAIAFGTGIGLMRMAFGAHFFTDVAFAGIITFMIVWLVHGLIYRWPASRISDEAVERAIERIAPGALVMRAAALLGRDNWRRSGRAES
jgi:membrane-associated PAP2 superfamily phosphatase